MTATTHGDRPPQDIAAPAVDWQSGKVVSECPAKNHFDTFETNFFQQGDDSAGIPVATDQFDDLDQVAQGKHPVLSRQSLMGLATTSTCVAFLACLALWRSNAPAPAPPIAFTSSTATPPAPAADPEPVPVVPLPSEAPTPNIATKVEAEPSGAANAPSPESDAQDRCKKSIRGKRAKEILAACPAAFAENASDAETAVALAKVEFDRGRFAQAHAWSKKAIAVNPASAEAYVFVGGAEQYAGHAKAAKEAYKNYLRLAPSGRYAAELRTIVNSL
jgi:hypothetical protein